MISFVIPCYQSTGTLPTVINEINETMRLRGEAWEIIMVNDCSPDDTMQTIQNICDRWPNCIGVNLAKNFGQHAALMAGFHYVTGDIVVCLDDDGQTPANEVGKLLQELQNGQDVVYAKYSDKKHSPFRNFGSYVNECMASWLLGKPKDLYVSSYFAARRFVIEEIKHYTNSYPYVIGLVLRATKKIANADVTHREREVGQSGYTLKKLLGLWFNGFTSFSVKPLRFATFMGGLTAFAGFVYALVTVINKLFNPDVLLGWSSMICTLLIIGGIIMLMLGMIGEYIGRIYISLNNSPQYVIREVIKK